MAKQTLDAPSRDGAEPTPAEVRAALERILRSSCFEHAGRASDFLRFVVGKTLAGEADRLKGYTIADLRLRSPRELRCAIRSARARRSATAAPTTHGVLRRRRRREPVGSSCRAAVTRSKRAMRAPSRARAGGRTALATQARAWLLPRVRAGWAAAAVLLVAAIGAIAVQQRPPIAEDVAASAARARARDENRRRAARELERHGSILPGSRQA